MKVIYRIALSLLLLSWCFSLSAKVDCQKNGKLLTVRFYAEPTEEVTMDTVEQDFFEAIEIAQSQKCSNVIFVDLEEMFILYIKGKDEIAQPGKYFDSLRQDIERMEKREFKQGELIGTSKTFENGPKYRSETYKNGKLESVYESDWTHGYFRPETSTYKADGVTWVTKTMYVPPKYRTTYEYAPGTTTIIPGIEVFANIAYSRK